MYFFRSFVISAQPGKNSEDSSKGKLANFLRSKPCYITLIRWLYKVFFHSQKKRTRRSHLSRTDLNISGKIHIPVFDVHTAAHIMVENNHVEKCGLRKLEGLWRTEKLKHCHLGLFWQLSWNGHALLGQPFKGILSYMVVFYHHISKYQISKTWTCILPDMSKLVTD